MRVTELLALLSSTRRDVLLQVAVSNLPVTAHDIAAMLEHSSGLTAEIVDLALRALVQRSLITPLDDKTYFVQRWTAQGLKNDDPAQWRARSAAAAHYRMQQLQTSQDPQDAMEAARNLVEADEPERASQVASHVGMWMREAGHTIALAAFAGEILASISLRSSAAQGLAQLEADANEALGLTPAAERRWRDIAAAQAKLIDAEPDRADYQRDLSVSYERLGDLMRAVGRGEDAARLYQQSLDIAQALANAEPDRTDYQRGATPRHQDRAAQRSSAASRGGIFTTNDVPLVVSLRCRMHAYAGQR